MERAIIIPTYNRCSDLEVNLQKTLTYVKQPASVVILDNSSSDATQYAVENIVSAHRRKHAFFYCRHEKNVGASANFQHAFQIGSSKTQSFFVMADDDWIEGEFLDNAFHLLENTSSVITVTPAYCLHASYGLMAYAGDNCSYLDRNPLDRLRRYVSQPSSNSIFYSVRRGSCRSGQKLFRSIGADLFTSMYSLVRQPSICLDQYKMHRSLKNWENSSAVLQADKRAFCEYCSYPESYFQGESYFAHKFFDMMSCLWLAMAYLGVDKANADQLQKLYQHQVARHLTYTSFVELLQRSLQIRRRRLANVHELYKVNLANAYL